ncbi:PP2C family protein-serine/threonine phosphatase [Yinghuangia seranimata]|uniref:PP2C family protein-serine/threonine phosphatase n=1 Tax=Yinghuangia seranimata TaxID=408067 RepID=UPI00248C7EF8|nr:PP2C family protein-serine/threonine phosphatase [Yinghuangia seranimata]MDI2132168.1 PP2C family protein-serine/threonine phosphatase [Yinghuangia seranimata]
MTRQGLNLCTDDDAPPADRSTYAAGPYAGDLADASPDASPPPPWLRGGSTWGDWYRRKAPQLRVSAAAYGILLCLMVCDLYFGREIPGAVALGMIPPAFAALLPPWATARLAGATMVAAGVLTLHHNDTGSGSRVIHLSVVAGLCVVGVWASATRVRHTVQLGKARSATLILQRTVLEPIPADLPGYEVSALYLPADVDTKVGGDMFAVVRSRHGMRVLMGDVRGKGVGAIATAATLMACFREAAHYEPSLPGLAARLEERIAQLDEERAGPADERFATAVLFAFDEPNHLRMLSCGHTPPVHLRAGRAVELELPISAPPLGTAGLYDDLEYAEYRVSYVPGDVLVVVTDGVTEARDQAGRFYPFGERLARWAHYGSQRLAHELITDVTIHTGGRLEDDAAVLVVRRSPVPEPFDDRDQVRKVA